MDWRNLRTRNHEENQDCALAIKRFETEVSGVRKLTTRLVSGTLIYLNPHFNSLTHFFFDFRGIDWRSVELGDYKGHGSEGQVFKGTYLSSDVALKEVISATMSENEDLEDFADEVCLLSRISNHPHIVRFVGITKDMESSKKLFAVTEWCEMNLGDYLKQGPRFAGFDSDGDKKFSVDIVRSFGARSGRM